MVTKFNTAAAPATGSGGGSKTLITVLVLAGLAFLGYKYVYLPYKKRKEEEAAKAASNQ